MNDKVQSRRLPILTPETQHFWNGTKEGELLLQKCTDCETVYFPPRPFCPNCGSREVSIFPASGKATLYSYIINHMPTPGFDGPQSIAVVTLEEGPRMMTNIINCEQSEEVLQLDMPLKVIFEKQNDEITLPFFSPVE